MEGGRDDKWRTQCRPTSASAGDTLKGRGATRPVSKPSPGPRHSRESGNLLEAPCARKREPTGERHARESGNPPENAIIPAQAQERPPPPLTRPLPQAYVRAKPQSRIG